MFDENELRIIRRGLIDISYVRELSHAEVELVDKLNKMITEVHFNKKRDEERKKTRIWQSTPQGGWTGEL